MCFTPRHTCRFCKLTFQPSGSGATELWKKNTVLRDFPTFSHTWIFSLLTFSVSNLPTPDVSPRQSFFLAVLFHLSIVHIIKNLVNKFHHFFKQARQESDKQPPTLDEKNNAVIIFSLHDSQPNGPMIEALIQGHLNLTILAVDKACFIVIAWDILIVCLPGIHHLILHQISRRLLSLLDYFSTVSKVICCFVFQC